nr:MAG TPA_asm: hypothetical protein [Caudoviricetes sp.]
MSFKGNIEKFMFPSFLCEEFNVCITIHRFNGSITI